MSFPLIPQSQFSWDKDRDDFLDLVKHLLYSKHPLNFAFIAVKPGFLHRGGGVQQQL